MDEAGLLFRNPCVFSFEGDMMMAKFKGGMVSEWKEGTYPRELEGRREGGGGGL